MCTRTDICADTEADTDIDTDIDTDNRFGSEDQSLVFWIKAFWV